MNLRVAYAGTPEFAVPALEALGHSRHELVEVVTQPDRRAGRGRKIVESAVKKSALSSKLPVFQPEKINSKKALAHLAVLQIDLFVVAAYGQIFSPDLLALPRLGCINIHASLLPRWRGASPIQHAVLNGDEMSGVTIMQMGEAMDAGDIWFQESCKIEESDTAQSLHNRLAVLAGNIILPAMDVVLGGNDKPQPQMQNLVTYCSKLQKSDGLIDWQQPAEQITRKVRAFFPWPGAFTRYRGKSSLLFERARRFKNMVNRLVR